MKKQYVIGLAVLLAASALFAACKGGPAGPTATPRAPTSTLTPPAAITPPPTATPPLGARGTADAYLAAWQKGDYAGMYALLAPASQAALSAADFEQAYRKNLDIISATAYTPTVTNLSETGDTAEAQAHLTYATRLVGTLDTDVKLALQRAGEHWGVVYAPAMIWPELVDGKQLYMVPFVPDRGILYDRNGVAMVSTTDAVAIGVIPNQISEDDDSVANALSKLIGTSAADIKLLYQNAIQDQYVAIGEASAAELAKMSFVQNLPGVQITPYTARYYAGNGAGAHVTGYTIFIPPDQMADYQARGYSVDQRIGNSALELWGETQLAGRNGGQLTLLDSAGNPLRAIAIGQPTDAQDMYTTIDFNLQKAAQSALGDYTAAAVVIRVDDGEILALASSPTFDPNLFEPANLNRQFADNGAISAGLLNRAAQDAYPAGSIFKIVTFSAGLTSGLFTPASEYTCTGIWEELGPPPKTDWLEGGHGKLTMTQGLTGSCNPWFWHIGRALNDFNPGWLPQTARAFGLGQGTGLGQIEESPGLIPDPDWKLANKGAAWEVGDTLNVAVGQGDVLVTPLQIARMVAAVGNNGTLYQPQLVLKLQAPDSAPSFEFAPIAAGQLPINAEQLAALQEGMHNVTQDPIGTARNRFRGLRIPVAGKTGTAENGIPGALDPHAWFTGYSFAHRADKPDIAIAVWVGNSGQG
ncbi:MAG: penicillin-binding transpeptidase domain-containing protein, partial [Anaerolineales bacterium]